MHCILPPSASQQLSSPLRLTRFAAYGTYKAAFETRLEQLWSWTQTEGTHILRKPTDSKNTLILTLRPLQSSPG